MYAYTQLTSTKIHYRNQCPVVASMHTMLIGSDCMRIRMQFLYYWNHCDPSRELSTAYKWLSCIIVYKSPITIIILLKDYVAITFQVEIDTYGDAEAHV